ncbi:glycosyltransferase family 4 protein [Pseudonocardia sp. McavD-2-B]|uniref:glycosyltransferase family 4 protein n=1 Tax=Pseudonocardia sp. McavD-2-B TaxID=2954499 RepID=UPI0020979B9F|nr:glycosyltransferase family 4 protein [Pseudonocardia sp. McavD-2-B]MCO7193201.1 glycosyltransferase family 4 protein [Pseudonocardia sp. McavD-2-B]
MRIVYLYQYFATPRMPGGIRTYELARRLVADGHEVHVLTCDTSAERARARWRTTDEDGITVHWLPVPYSNSMGFARRVQAFLHFAAAASVRATRLRGDVVLASSTPLTIVLPGLVACVLSRARFVFEIRDLWPELPIAIGALGNPVTRRAAWVMARTAYRRADHVVALSPGMADGAIAQGADPDRVSVVSNASDLALFDVDPSAVADFRRSRPWLGDRPLVVYIGTFGQINGVGYLVRLAAEMAELDPEVRFLLVGGGRERDEVTVLARELGVLDRSVIVERTIPKREVPAVLGAATVATSLFLPIREMETNSANKFFDSLAAGRPQAINYGGWQAEILTMTGAGAVLDPTDHRRAALRLRELLHDEAWLAAASVAARKVAEERFARDDLYETFAAAVTGREPGRR